MHKVIEEELKKEYNKIDEDTNITREDNNILKQEILRKYNRIHRALCKE